MSWPGLDHGRSGCRQNISRRTLRSVRKCAAAEYYPALRVAILERHAGEMAALIPQDAALIEFGSGSTRKARMLLDAAPAITAYVPVDISSEMLLQEAAELRRDYPRLTVLPVEADFTKTFRLPRGIASRRGQIFRDRRSAISNRTPPPRF
jgi:uncharacterized SAM-dependent methyltransferase